MGHDAGGALGSHRLRVMSTRRRLRRRRQLNRGLQHPWRRRRTGRGWQQQPFGVECARPRVVNFVHRRRFLRRCRTEEHQRLLGQKRRHAGGDSAEPAARDQADTSFPHPTARLRDCVLRLVLHPRSLRVGERHASRRPCAEFRYQLDRCRIAEADNALTVAIAGVVREYAG
eukprot:scaffold1926_cov122-Isochrysis_galbana.AAC.7